MVYYEITFIYRTDIDTSVQYGKLLMNYISENNEGIDNVVKPHINTAINSYLLKNDLPVLKTVEIGILGLSNYYCSNEEAKMKMFDLYIDCCDYCDSNSLEWKRYTYNYKGYTGLYCETPNDIICNSNIQYLKV